MYLVGFLGILVFGTLCALSQSWQVILNSNGEFVGVIDIFYSRVLGAGKTVGKNIMRSALTQHENLNSCFLFWLFRF